MSEPLWAKDAVSIVGLLRAGEITPQEVLHATEERVGLINPKVNALPTLCFERARAELTSGREWAATLLGGLPIPIKDSYPVAGVRTTFGSRVYEDHVRVRLSGRELTGCGGRLVNEAGS